MKEAYHLGGVYCNQRKPIFLLKLLLKSLVCRLKTHVEQYAHANVLGLGPEVADVVIAGCDYPTPSTKGLLAVQHLPYVLSYIIHTTFVPQRAAG